MKTIKEIQEENRKIIILNRVSKLTASSRMVFFKIPASRKIWHIRVLEDEIIENRVCYSIYIYYKDGTITTTDRIYNSLSYAVSEALRFIKL